MATAVTMQIHGWPEMHSRLERLAGRVEDNLMLAALAGAQPVVGAVQRRTPVRTGNLRRSYHAESGDRAPTAVTVVVGTDVEYAKWVEFGTSRMAAQPHLRPGVLESIPLFVAGAQRALEAIIGHAAWTSSVASSTCSPPPRWRS
jgi:HK97 gp10 family phage protein